jgi:hypothetical protein
MSDIPDKSPDSGKKARRRLNEEDGFSEAEDGKTQALETADNTAALPSAPAPALERTAGKVKGPPAQEGPRTVGQAARMGFRRARNRPRR